MATSEVAEEIVKKGKHSVASKGVRKAKYTFNKLLKEWGRPPVGEDWLLRVHAGGYHLNTSCKWHIDETLFEEEGLGHKSPSVWGLTTKHPEHTPDKGTKLPAQSAHPKKHVEDDAE